MNAVRAQREPAGRYMKVGGTKRKSSLLGLRWWKDVIMGSDDIKSVYLIICIRGYFNDDPYRHINADFIEVICSLNFFIA